MHNAKIVQINAYPTYRAAYMRALEARYSPPKPTMKEQWFTFLVWIIAMAFCAGFWWGVVRLARAVI